MQVLQRAQGQSAGLPATLKQTTWMGMTIVLLSQATCVDAFLGLGIAGAAIGKAVVVTGGAIATAATATAGAVATAATATAGAVATAATATAGAVATAATATAGAVTTATGATIAAAKAAGITEVVIAVSVAV